MKAVITEERCIDINTFAEFCRVANRHVPSRKPLFKRTNVILKEKNDSAYSPSIHYDREKDMITMVLQHLTFLNG